MSTWIKAETKIKLLTCILVSTFVSILTPILLKSVIDGFFSAMDGGAIRFALAVIAGIEASAVIASAVFRREVDALCENRSRELKVEVITQMSESPKEIDWHEFDLLWNRDLRTLTHQDVRLRWMRYQDAVMMAILSIVAVSMSFLAGALILTLLSLQALSAWISKNQWGNAFFRQKSAEDQELKIARSWLAQRRQATDRGLSASKSAQLLSESAAASQYTAQANHARAAMEDSHRLIRGLGIVGVIAIGVLFNDEGSFSVGTLWALALVMFRVSGPSQNVAKWLFSEPHTQRARQRLAQLLAESRQNGPLDAEASTPLYRSIKSILSAEDLRSEVGFILAPTPAIRRIEDCFRLWARKNRSVATTRLWIGELPAKEQWAELLSGVDVLVLTSQFRLGSSRENIESFFENYRKANPKGRLYIVDSIPWETQRIALWGFWTEKTDQIQLLAAAQPIDLALPQEVQERSLEAIRAASPDWDTMVRDLQRLARINAPCAVLVLDEMEESRAARYRRVIREYDHFVLSPTGARILVFVNCPLERWQSSLERVRGASQDAHPLNVLEVAGLRIQNDPENRGLQDTIRICAHALFRPRSSYSPIASLGRAA